MSWFRPKGPKPEPQPFQGPVYSIGVNQDRDGTEVTLTTMKIGHGRIVLAFPPAWAREVGQALIAQADACERLTVVQVEGELNGSLVVGVVHDPEPASELSHEAGQVTHTFGKTSRADR